MKNYVPVMSTKPSFSPPGQGGNMSTDTVTYLDPWLREVEVEVTLQRAGDSSHDIYRFQPPPGYQKPEAQVKFKDVPVDLGELRYPIFLDAETAVADEPWNILEHACRLNIMELASRIPLLDMPLASKFEACPIHMEPDRMWIEVYHDGYPTTLEKMFKLSRWWRNAPGGLHHPPSEVVERTWKRGASFKEASSMFPALQVTLWSDINGCNYVELDIDLESGTFSHIAEVLKNFVTGGKTHPYVVAQLLAVYRGIPTFCIHPQNEEVVDAD